MKHLIFFIVLFLLSLLKNPVYPVSLKFKYHTIDANPNGQKNDVCLIGDIDRDGIQDVVIGGKLGNENLVWYKNSENGGWDRYPIATANLEAGGLLYDLDFDGDLDIIVGQPAGYKDLYWFECPSNPKELWKRHLICNLYDMYHDQAIGDIDGDGNPELVFTSQKSKKLMWVNIPDEPQKTSWENPHIIAEVKSEGLAIADVDKDGDNDIIFGNFWFENLNNNHFQEHKYSDFESPRVALGDLNRDGWLEIVLSEGEKSGGRLGWYGFNPDNKKWTEHIIAKDLYHAHSLQLADINEDGKLDIFCAEMRLRNPEKSRVLFYLNKNVGSFITYVVSDSLGTHESKLADVDNDGDLDIIIKPYSENYVGYFENKTDYRVPLNRFVRHIIDDHKKYRTIFITARDINGDGWLDIITGGWWYKNPGRNGLSWRKHNIGDKIKNYAGIWDINRNGNLDILGTTGEGSSSSGIFYWADNLGEGENWKDHLAFSVEQGDFLQGFALANFIPGGGPEATLSWHRANCGIQLVRPFVNNGKIVWQVDTISEFSQDEALSPGDIDRDGDIDLLLGTYWLENKSSKAGKWKIHQITNQISRPDRNVLADINKDGKLDAVIGQEAVSDTGIVAWCQNPGALDVPWAVNKIGEAIGPMSLDVGDLDRDGDLDVIVGEHNKKFPREGRVIVFENQDLGRNWISHVIDTGFEHHDGTQLFDMDNDGDLDILSISWTDKNIVLFYENKGQTEYLPFPISFTLTRPQEVKIFLFDKSCHPIYSFKRFFKDSGKFLYIAAIDSFPNIPADENIYFIRFVAPEKSLVKKIVFLSK